MIRLACPSCQAVQQFGDDCAGKTIACPRCRKPMQVPVTVPATPASAGPPGSYTVPVRSEQPDFVVPQEARMNPWLLRGVGLAAVLLLIAYLLSLMPKKEPELSPGNPIVAQKKKDLVYTRDPAEVVKEMKNPDESVRLKAVKELEVRGVGGQDALNMLVGVVKDTSKTTNVHLDMRRSAARAIGKIGNLEDESTRTDLASTLQAALKDQDEGVRYAAMEGLGKLGQPGVLPLVQVLLTFSTNKKPAMRAGEVLASMGEDAKPAINSLQSVMKGAGIHDRMRLASFVVRIDPRGPGLGPHLNAGLKSPDQGVRKQALVIISKMGKSARGLSNQLSYVASNDGNAELRGMAQQALDKMNQN